MNNSALTCNQYAYTDGYNCMDALIDVQNNYIKALDDKDCTHVRIFAIDFSKAFDNVFEYGPFFFLFWEEVLISGGRWITAPPRAVLAVCTYLIYFLMILILKRMNWTI